MDATRMQFDKLQRGLVPLWHLIGRCDPGGPIQEHNTIVVVPSLTVDLELTSAVAQALEERFLFMLLLLRQPHVRLIFLTSQPIQPAIVDYVLHLVPGHVATHARNRLFLLSPHDASSRPLTSKLLERPRLLSRIRELIPDPHRAHLVPFITTDQELELAVRLQLPMYGSDPRYAAFGTKSGSRQIFAEEGVAHPLGREHLRSADDLIAAVTTLRTTHPALRRVIVKLNQGVMGTGNAVLDLHELPPTGDPLEQQALVERLHGMRFEQLQMSYERYFATLSDQGGIVEELIEAEQIRSPSVQLRVSPLGEVELLSTHDQILGGAGGQTYIGARFPADTAYSSTIAAHAATIGRRLAREGVIGRFALDFVVVRNGAGPWRPFALEINLRKGGTTHPFLTLQYLTDGRYDPDRGVFRTSHGAEKYYLASDRVESALYRVFTPNDILTILTGQRLLFDHHAQIGIVVHSFSAVGETGRLGLTAIAGSHAEAERLYACAITTLDRAAQAAHARTD